MLFNSDFNVKSISLPIRINDGKIELLYADFILPAMRNTSGDLVIPLTAITDLDLLDVLERVDQVELFPKNTQLYVNLRGANFTTEQKNAISDRSPEEVPRFAVPGTTFLDSVFVEVRTMEPQKMLVQCTKKPELMPCKYTIPKFSDQKPKSLNEAYRIISEKMEPDRRSHTGNVFQKVFYDREEGLVQIDAKRKEFEIDAEKNLITFTMPWWRHTNCESWAVAVEHKNGTFYCSLIKNSGELFDRHEYGDMATLQKWLKDNGYNPRVKFDKYNPVFRPRPPYKDETGKHASIFPPNYQHPHVPYELPN